MRKKVLLSAVVSVFNGEKELDECLKSLSFADEIIVVNNSSTDNTNDIARKYTDKIFLKVNNPMLNINKNFGFSKATGEWILYLDADERVTEGLEEEIKGTIKEESGADGYWIPRKNIIFGKWIEHTGWYPDHQLRLFRNGKGRFAEKHVHEMVKVNGKIEYLKNNLIHYSYPTIARFLSKLNIYVTNEAEQLIEGGYQLKWRDALSFPAKEFLSRFFAREGYKDGFHGLILSMLMAFYHLLIIAIVWEKKGFEQIDKENFNEEIKAEAKKYYKDLFFWINNEKLKAIKNPLGRVVHKIINKFR